MRLEINSNLVDLVTARVYTLHNLGKKQKILHNLYSTWQRHLPTAHRRTTVNKLKRQTNNRNMIKLY